MTARFTAILGFVLLWATGFAQIPTGLPSLPKPVPAAEGFPSARAAVRSLVEAVKQGDLDQARRSLDLSRIIFAVREREGNRRVLMAIAILNRIDRFQVDDVSDEATRERVLIPIRTSKQSFAVGQLELLPHSGGGWTFSSDTVDALPDYWQTLRDRPPVNSFPTDFEGSLDHAQRLRTKFGPMWWREFLGLELWQWMGLGILLVGGFALPRLARQMVKKNPALRRRFVIGGSWLVVSVAWIVALRYFDLPLEMLAFALLIARSVAALASIVVGIALVDTLLNAASQRATGLGRRADSIFFPILRNFLRFVWVGVVLVTVLATLDVNVTGIVAGLGIGGLVLALAAKDSVENLFGSVTILFDMPFGIGDWVKIGDVNGVVEEINLRSTRIRTFSDSVITLPNSNLTKAAVENFGARRRRRIDMSIAVGHGNSLDAVKAMCADIRAFMVAHERIAEDSAYAYVTSISDTSVTVAVQGYIITSDYQQELEIREALVTAIRSAAEAHGVELGPPTAAPAPRVG